MVNVWNWENFDKERDKKCDGGGRTRPTNRARRSGDWGLGCGIVPGLSHYPIPDTHHEP
jgi:hypothetical protein